MRGLATQVTKAQPEAQPPKAELISKGQDFMLKSCRDFWSGRSEVQAPYGRESLWREAKKKELEPPVINIHWRVVLSK